MIRNWARHRPRRPVPCAGLHGGQGAKVGLWPQLQLRLLPPAAQQVGREKAHCVANCMTLMASVQRLRRPGVLQVTHHPGLLRVTTQDFYASPLLTCW